MSLEWYRLLAKNQSDDSAWGEKKRNEREESIRKNKERAQSDPRVKKKKIIVYEPQAPEPPIRQPAQRPNEIVTD